MKDKEIERLKARLEKYETLDEQRQKPAEKPVAAGQTEPGGQGKITAKKAAPKKASAKKAAPKKVAPKKTSAKKAE